MSLPLWIAVVAIVVLIVWLLLRWVDRRNRVQVYTPQDDDRQFRRLKPYLRREVVERKVKSLFPNQDHAQILQLLDSDFPYSLELERMQLDILKLSDGNLDQLHNYIDVAKSEQGFMKVIQLAESPESSLIDIEDKDPFWGEHKRLIERDFRHYLNWLKKK